MDSFRGRLLVASPELADPNFARAVVLILDHGRDGAFGLVLNRPTDEVPADALGRWAGVASDPGVVFVGGPVGLEQVVGLALGVDQPATRGWAPLFGGPDDEPGHAGLASVDLDAGPDAASFRRVRIFAGYAGWSADQLEAEIEEGSWFVVDAYPACDVFTADPRRLWSVVLRRQPGRTAWFANCPEDRSTN